MTNLTPPTTWETIAAIAQDMRACAEAERVRGNQLLQLANAARAERSVPTVMEIIGLADEIEAADLGQVDLVRAALARWGRPAAPPADLDAESLAIMAEVAHLDDVIGKKTVGQVQQLAARARAVLAITNQDPTQ